MASVLLRGVSKTYGDLDAVKAVDLEIAEGEFVVLLGPSGCGKTTTLRMIAGFSQPTDGQILIGGEDVTDLPPRLRNIGMVFQDYALFPNMTVAENVGFGLRERKVPRHAIEERVGELLSLVRLPSRANAYIHELSGGQQQRVALARALAFNPRLLLMDEPLGALDLKLREAMQIELHRIQKTLGITTIMVTHDQQEAMSLSDRIVVMADGEVQQVGSPQDLYTAPRTRFVADFIGKNNMLDGEIASVEEGRYLVRVANAFQVEVPPVGSLRPGQTVEISVRPEQLRVLDGPPEGLNAVRGQVEARRFLGNVVYYSVRLPNGTLLLVESSTHGPMVEEGGAVDVGWRPEAGTVFLADKRIVA